MYHFYAPEFSQGYHEYLHSTIYSMLNRLPKSRRVNNLHGNKQSGEKNSISFSGTPYLEAELDLIRL